MNETTFKNIGKVYKENNQIRIQAIFLNVLAKVIMACTGNSCDITYDAPREGDIHRSLADTRRLEATLGRVAACSLADGLSETIAWCRGTPE